MSTQTRSSSESWKGVPLADRDPAHIEDALAGQDEEVVATALKVHAYIRSEHIGVSKLAHRAGIQSSIISQFFNGSYPGDCAAIAERFEKFFWRLAQRDLYGGIRKFVETRLALYLWSVFEKTRVIRRIQIIQSPEQLGKTRAAREYAARNNSGRTVMVSLSGGTRSGCGDFIWDLADTLGLPYTIKMREKRARIKHSLEGCDLLIIDEAHLIWAWHDKAVRDFFDYLRTDIHANGARGVVLIATNSDMLGAVNSFRKSCGYNTGQLLGRMRNETVELDPAGDIVEEDVQALVERYYKPDESSVRKLHEIAQRENLGHFGLVEDILNEAWTRAKAAKKPLSDKAVLDTAAEILAGMKNRRELYK